MNKKYEISKNNFIFDWILKNKLAVGTSPVNKENVSLLKKYDVKYILGLCDEEESKWHEELENNFLCTRIVLPDSNKNKLPTDTQIKNAFNTLKNFVEKDITFVHCFASVERSPLLCIMFIMDKYKINLEEALDYVKRMHFLTNPRNNQLFFIKSFINHNV